MSPKTQERLLFLISPIGLIALWQVLLMAGIGDRRFVPAPSDIAWRYWEMLASGELAKHALVTLWRVFAGFFIGSIPGIAVGLLMAMFRPVSPVQFPLLSAPALSQSRASSQSPEGAVPERFDRRRLLFVFRNQIPASPGFDESDRQHGETPCNEPDRDDKTAENNLHSQSTEEQHQA